MGTDIANRIIKVIEGAGGAGELAAVEVVGATVGVEGERRAIDAGAPVDAQLLHIVLGELGDAHIEIDHRREELGHRLGQHQQVRVARLEQLDAGDVDGIQIAVDDNLPADGFDLDAGNLPEHGLDLLQHLGRVGLGGGAGLLFGQHQHVLIELGGLLDPCQVLTAQATLQHHLATHGADAQPRNIRQQSAQLADLAVAIGLGHHHADLLALVIGKPQLHRGFPRCFGGDHHLFVLQHGGADDLHVADGHALHTGGQDHMHIAVVQHHRRGNLVGLNLQGHGGTAHYR